MSENTHTPMTLLSLTIKQRALIWQFTKRNIETRHKGNALGLLWLILNPLIQMCIYSFVFGVIFEARFNSNDESGLSYALGIFLSLTIYQFIAETLNSAPSIIVGNPNFVKKVVFPLEVLPIATVGAALYNLIISLILTLIGVLAFGGGFTFGMLFFPLIILPAIILALGMAWLISSLGVFFKDLQHAVGHISLIMMYASAIFYSKEMVVEKSPKIWELLRFNPIVHVIEQSRRAILWDATIQWNGIIYSYFIGTIVFFSGFIIFKKLRTEFADLI